MNTLFLTKVTRIYNGEKIISSIKWCWENQTATCKRMNTYGVRTLPNTIHKDELKMIERPKCRTRNYKTLRGQKGQTSR